MTYDVLDNLPRGCGREDREEFLDTTPAAEWADPADLAADPALQFDPDHPGSKIFLGEVEGQLVGLADDRHVITVAGSRAGKGVSASIPNLLTWPGAGRAIDPKGELACITAEQRATALEQRVCVLDPFGRVAGVRGVKDYRVSYNPLTILYSGAGQGGEKALSKTAVEDAGLIADALVVPGGGDTHWDDAARNLLEGLILHVATCEDYRHKRNLVTVRELLMEGTAHEDMQEQDEDKRHKTGMPGLEAQMRDNAEAVSYRDEDVADAISFAAADFFEKPETERGSVLSTARRHTKFLDFRAIKDVVRRHDFDLTDLKTRAGGMTVYLCLPATRLSTCSRWLRLFVNLALEAMERFPDPPPVPVLMVLDEFAVMGRLKQLEDAAGQIAGFGVKLWPVLQDLTQLKALYAERWETFLGHAGILQFFGNNDVTTLEFIEKRLGRTTINVKRYGEVTQDARNKGQTGLSIGPEVHPLMTVDEAARFFARDDWLARQLIIRASAEAPMILQRITYFDHPDFKGRARNCQKEKRTDGI